LSESEFAGLTGLYILILLKNTLLLSYRTCCGISFNYRRYRNKCGM